MKAMDNDKIPTGTTYVILFDSEREKEHKVIDWFYGKVDNDKNYKKLLKLERHYEESMVHVTLMTSEKDKLLKIDSIPNAFYKKDYCSEKDSKYLTLSEEEYCLRYSLMNICVSEDEMICVSEKSPVDIKIHSKDNNGINIPSKDNTNSNSNSKDNNGINIPSTENTSFEIPSKENNVINIPSNKSYGIKFSSTKNNHRKISLNKSNGINIPSGDSIVSVLEENEVILDFFPLHNKIELKKLKKKWYWDFSIFTLGVPDEVQSYFGETVAMYFKFLGFYTMLLIIPTILGIVAEFYSFKTPMKITFFAVFNLVWATFFLEFWKRQCAELSFNWGTLTCSIDNEVTPHYCGKGRHKIVFNRYKDEYPIWKRRLKIMASTLVVVIGALFAMWLAVYGEEIISNITFNVSEDLGNPLLKCTHFFTNRTNTFMFLNRNEFQVFSEYISVMVDYYIQIIVWLLNFIQFSTIQLYVYGAFEVMKEFFYEHWFDFKTSTAIYAAIVWGLNHIYSILAFRLTKWENHRLQGDFDWHHISRIVVLEFINNFSSLFYIAFYIQDMESLRSQVSTMLIVKQIINQFEETIFPYILKKIKRWISKMVQHNEEENKNQKSDVQKSDLILQTEKEAQLEIMEDAVDDYLEMFVQFGYVCLFSSAFPLAAFWAFLNNVIEIKSDAFKFCNLYKRPKVKRVRSIGVWQGAFELLGVVGVATNCALLCMSPSLQAYASNWNPVHWVLLFVAVEHMTLSVKAAVMYIVDDQPRWIREILEEGNSTKSTHEDDRNKKLGQKKILRRVQTLLPGQKFTSDLHPHKSLNNLSNYENR